MRYLIGLVLSVCCVAVCGADKRRIRRLAIALGPPKRYPADLDEDTEDPCATGSYGGWGNRWRCITRLPKPAAGQQQAIDTNSDEYEPDAGDLLELVMDSVPSESSETEESPESPESPETEESPESPETEESPESPELSESSFDVKEEDDDDAEEASQQLADDLLTADERFLDCCRRESRIGSTCYEACNYDNYDRQWITQNFIRKTCPLEQVGRVHFCATRWHDHRGCCERAGVPPLCNPFCAPHIEKMERKAKFIPCLKKHWTEIKGCIRTYDEDNRVAVDNTKPAPF